ncbi:probable L-asparaginase periplasmic [Ptychodera flava]|uniref:probable L-asparaginase periplasmic n=1 Tax=Ptychodera flava TaxID=63121 RepID=UPI00396A9D28
MSTSPILAIQTGGTIDKDYPRGTNAFGFEIGDSAVRSILEAKNITIPFGHSTVCRKDSQQISQQDRLALSEICKCAEQKKIIITHGTDTMIETAAFLARQNLDKTIILTGSFLPNTFKNSDAEFNIGVAIGAVQCIVENDVFVAMNGRVFRWDQVTRDETGQFMAQL